MGRREANSCALAFALVALGAAAQEAPKVMPATMARAERMTVLYVAGIGARSCKSFVEAIAADDASSAAVAPRVGGRAPRDAAFGYMEWANGYISAYNTLNVLRAEPFQFRTKDSDIAAWLRDYCVQHPDVRFMEAAYSLVRGPDDPVRPQAPASHP